VPSHPDRVRRNQPEVNHQGQSLRWFLDRHPPVPSTDWTLRISDSPTYGCGWMKPDGTFHQEVRDSKTDEVLEQTDGPLTYWIGENDHAALPEKPE
jgi:hypothetical protein